jgi:hypothetical protein
MLPFRHPGPEAGALQSVIMKALQPLRVADIGLTSGHDLASAR